MAQSVDMEGRLVSGDELEAVGGLGGARLGSGMNGGLWGAGRKRGRLGSVATETVDGEGEDVEAEGEGDGDDEGMEIS